MKTIIAFYSVGSRFTNILLSLAFFFYLLGQLGRISLPGQPVYFYLYEIFVYIATVVLALRYRFEPWRRKKAIAWPTVYFLAWMGISLCISFFFYTFIQDIVALLYLLRLGIYVLLMIYLYIYIYDYPQLKKGFHIALFVVAIGIIVSSLVQYFYYQDLGNIAYLGWDPHQYRLVGVFFDPPIAVSVFTLFFLYYFFSRGDWQQYIYYALGVTFVILMFLTYSRGGYLAFLLTAIAFAIQKLKVLYGGLALVIGAIVILLLPKSANESINLLRTTTIVSRAHDYSIAIEIWKKSPVWGIGYNHIRYEKDSYAPEIITEAFNPSHASASFHSSFLIILTTGGLIGLGLYAWSLYRIAMLHELAQYSIVFLSLLSFSDNVLLHPMVLFLLIILVAVGRISPPVRISP